MRSFGQAYTYKYYASAWYMICRMPVHQHVHFVHCDGRLHQAHHTYHHAHTSCRKGHHTHITHTKANTNRHMNTWNPALCLAGAHRTHPQCTTEVTPSTPRTQPNPIPPHPNWKNGEMISLQSVRPSPSHHSAAATDAGATGSGCTSSGATSGSSSAAAAALAFKYASALTGLPPPSSG